MKHRGFTLIELMVVIAILVLLVGMITPILGIARTKAANTNTASLLTKIDAGLEMFKGELDTYPYHWHNPSDPFTGTGNNLAYRLATNFNDLSAGEQVALSNDMQAARDAYTTDVGFTHVVIDAETDTRYGDGSVDGSNQRLIVYAEFVNRLAIERATMAVLAGNPEVRGIKGAITDNTAVSVISNPSSNGYTFDYLSSDIGPSERSGNDILDFWGNPLVYNCPVTQGVTNFFPNTISYTTAFFGSYSKDDPPIDPEFYLMYNHGHPTDVGVASDVAGGTRTRLSKGRVLTQSLDSDQRNTAAGNFVSHFEVWSAGADGLIHETRNNSQNKDNLSPDNYLEGLE